MNKVHTDKWGEGLMVGRKPTNRCRKNNKFRKSLSEKNQWMPKLVEEEQDI